MLRPRYLVALAVLTGACALAALPGPTPLTAPVTAVRAAAPAPHRHLEISLGSLLFTQHPVSTKPATPRPTPTHVKATGNGPGGSATRNHHTPVTVTGNPYVAGVAWQKHCSTQFGFCIEFPYAVGSKDAYETHDNYTSGTSITGYLFNFTGDLWVADSGHGYCQLEFTKGCNPSGTNDEYYFVEVIPHSKYAADPWQALTAINMGVHDPVRIDYRGNLACVFAKGIYGGPGMVVWHDGRVYYLESGNGNLTPNNPVLVQGLLRSLTFVG